MVNEIDFELFQVLSPTHYSHPDVAAAAYSLTPTSQHTGTPMVKSQGTLGGAVKNRLLGSFILLYRKRFYI